jgi:3-dehydroquinate synthase
MHPSVSIPFSSTRVDYYFDASFRDLGKIVSKDKTVLITDERVFSAHPSKFRGWNTIVLKPGEQYKVQATVDSIIAQLINYEADRGWTLVGVGGGVVTDITGYAASVYMRGIRFGFVPTTLLAMVDASIGGKNGIDVGPYKNLVGTIRQPAFLLFDTAMLRSLPDAEWTNGFAEIIKHACILDRSSFNTLQQSSPAKWRKDTKALSQLIERNARLKSKVVQQDEFETGKRKLLNFGHTLGHAFETQYGLPHGQAISIGMTCASMFSEDILGFRGHAKLRALLEQYGLPTFLRFDADKVLSLLRMDKKRAGKDIRFILLERIGKGVVKGILIRELEARVSRIALIN